MRVLSILLLVGSLIGVSGQSLLAQSTVTPEMTLDQLPGYSSYQKVLRGRRQLVSGGRVSQVKWSADGEKFSFKTTSGETKLFSVDRKSVIDSVEFEAFEPPESPRRRVKSRVGRALQRTVEVSPDDKWKAVYREFNVWLEPNREDGANAAIPITEDGDARHRYGTCCWVYGEELDQSEAMWWSPDSRYLVYYEVQEKGMRDYFLTTGNTNLYTEILAVRYPKAGDPNPQVNLWVYDTQTKEKKRLEIAGEPTQYLYNIQFPTSSNTMVVSRTNRQQNVLDVFAVDAATGGVRKILTESQATWQDNAPAMRFLKDQQRFVWETERNGYRHFELRTLNGKRLNPISQIADYPCERIVDIDEASGFVYYTAYSDKNPYNQQLHRVRLDGSDHVRITTSPLNHTSFVISPFDNVVIAVREQVNVAPETVVYSAETGEQLAELANSSMDTIEDMGIRLPELFSFPAEDGETEIWGTLHFPTHFDPSKKYPLLIDVYGGPGSRGLSNRYRPAYAACEFGFVVAKIGNRGTIGRGKSFESATYLKLGGPDLDDQAAGVKFLAKREYIDGNRVGIFGHSYGGYMTALALLRYPDVFHCGVSGAPVTDWRNYDTIYTERYMQTPQLNEQGYRQGSCMKYVDQLKGRLLLVHGLIDDNVHPANTWQLAKALQDAGKRFDMMIYPGFKHGIGSTYSAVRWEYFYKHLHPQAN